MWAMYPCRTEVNLNNKMRILNGFFSANLNIVLQPIKYYDAYFLLESYK